MGWRSGLESASGESQAAGLLLILHPDIVFLSDSSRTQWEVLQPIYQRDSRELSLASPSFLAPASGISSFLQAPARSPKHSAVLCHQTLLLGVNRGEGCDSGPILRDGEEAGNIAGTGGTKRKLAISQDVELGIVRTLSVRSHQECCHSLVSGGRE